MRCCTCDVLDDLMSYAKPPSYFEIKITCILHKVLLPSLFGRVFNKEYLSLAKCIIVKTMMSKRMIFSISQTFDQIYIKVHNSHKKTDGQYWTTCTQIQPLV